MNILKYSILALIILNLPESFLKLLSPTLGTISSYATFLLLIVYYMLIPKGRLNVWVLLIAISYYTISSFQTMWQLKEFAFISFKFLVVVICGNELVKRVTPKELSIFFTIGSSTILIHSLFFPDDYGRYSGLYFNPNAAGFIAIIAFSLTFGLQKEKLMNLVSKPVSSLGGLLTFSRTFVVLWTLINLLSLRISIKNVKMIGLGVGVIIFLLTFGELFQVNTIRFNQFEGLINQDASAASGLKDDSRTATWSLYLDDILENPFFGNGYASFQGKLNVVTGVHNSFLLILGEGGIIPFLLFASLIFYILFWGFRLFDIAPNLFMMGLGLFAVLMADHGFFYYYNFCLITMWLQHQISVKKSVMLNKQTVISKT